ncbi:MAG: ABC-F family ATP-binding cassette domain-containing protein [Myxococcales bacterium]|nr:ABC-F family ATP-binding cassette domain-containing protein [Myxococcales bacterium]
MSSLSISSLGKQHGAQTLFRDATLNFNPGSRYGVVGANGSGKSTILRILAGEEEASEGEINIPSRAQVGWLRQDHYAYDHIPIIEVVMMGNRELYEAMAEKERLLANAHIEFDGDRYSELEDIVLKHDGYSLEALAAELLEGLNIPSAKHREPLSVLSGGYKLRVLLAQTLASKPDILLLDEPTNHLDILSIRWLEKFLLDYRGVVLVVSHDRRFLNAIATHIVDVDYERVTLYTGSYDDFVMQKEEYLTRQEAEIEKRQKEIDEHKAFIERFRAKATKARQANSRAKRMAKIVIEELPQTSRRYPKFKFHQARPSGRLVVAGEGISKRYGDKQVLSDVSIRVERGDRLAILGPNGIGKSTLLKILLGRVQPDAGKIEWGHETYPGYFGQDHDGVEDAGSDNLLSWLWNQNPDRTHGFIRGKLAEVLFEKDDVEKKVKSLSGGETSRLVFAQLGLSEANVLVLDEPTNHLDFEGIEALADGLDRYEGTLIFVSHNRWFVDALATRILEVRPDGIEDYKGTYREYLAHCGDDHLDAEAVYAAAKQKKVGGKRAG